ncbi:MAG: hypothetical protein ETSY2_31235 [Candidatus Entotheonella gemina]|uniref:Uncharacterized protein n=1 Tax=Candidatus Entotheonella gemina TaxID=1429439 RepID=W4M1E6_9BACT|nr:MAG: hypothetical protein ETSY2_31235 [Candidatus Entotheonella gemina]
MDLKDVTGGMIAKALIEAEMQTAFIPSIYHKFTIALETLPRLYRWNIPVNPNFTYI